MSASDGRAHIADLLSRHKAADAAEAYDVALIIRLLDEQPNLLSRDCAIGHITASALIVHRDNRRLLLHYHKRLNRWLQFGGHLDGETDPAAAAMREAVEETGLPDLTFCPDACPLDIDVHAIPERDNEPRHLHLDLRFLLMTRSPKRLNPAAGESTRFRWLTFDEALALDDMIDPALKRLIRKADASTRAPRQT